MVILDILYKLFFGCFFLINLAYEFMCGNFIFLGTYGSQISLMIKLAEVCVFYFQNLQEKKTLPIYWLSETKHVVRSQLRGKYYKATLHHYFQKQPQWHRINLDFFFLIITLSWNWIEMDKHLMLIVITYFDVSMLAFLCWFK